MRAVGQPNRIVSLGGGAVVKPENMKVLKENTISICLTASEEDIFKRVKKTKSKRPLLEKNPEERIKKLLKEREPYYKQADFTVNTSGKDPNDIVQEIKEILLKHQKN